MQLRGEMGVMIIVTRKMKRCNNPSRRRGGGANM